MARNRVEKVEKVEEVEKVEKVEKYKKIAEKLRTAIPKIKENLETSGKTNYTKQLPLGFQNGMVQLSVFRNNTGEIRAGIQFVPNGSNPLYNRLRIETIEHLEFLREIVSKFKDIEVILRAVVEANEELELEDIDFEIKV